MAASLDMEHIASALGAVRGGKVSARGGYFGALQLAAEVSERFRDPKDGEHATDPSWSEEGLVRLSPQTLERLVKLAEQAHTSPMQVASLLLEQAAQAGANSGQMG